MIVDSLIVFPPLSSSSSQNSTRCLTGISLEKMLADWQPLAIAVTPTDQDINICLICCYENFDIGNNATGTAHAFDTHISVLRSTF